MKNMNLNEEISRKWEIRIFFTMAMLSFIGALLCLSPSMTGNVIGELSLESSNLLGIIFFIIGLASIGIIEIRD